MAANQRRVLSWNFSVLWMATGMALFCSPSIFAQTAPTGTSPDLELTAVDKLKRFKDGNLKIEGATSPNDILEAVGLPKDILKTGSSEAFAIDWKKVESLTLEEQKTVRDAISEIQGETNAAAYIDRFQSKAKFTPPGGTETAVCLGCILHQETGGQNLKAFLAAGPKEQTPFKAVDSVAAKTRPDCPGGNCGGGSPGECANGNCGKGAGGNPSGCASGKCGGAGSGGEGGAGGSGAGAGANGLGMMPPGAYPGMYPGMMGMPAAGGASSGSGGSASASSSSSSSSSSGSSGSASTGAVPTAPSVVSIGSKPESAPVIPVVKTEKAESPGVAMELPSRSLASIQLEINLSKANKAPAATFDELAGPQADRAVSSSQDSETGASSESSGEITVGHGLTSSETFGDF